MMKILIFTAVAVFFIGVLAWNFSRAVKGKSSCGCDEGCSGDCCGAHKHNQS